MALEKCKKHDCDQLVEVSCDKVVILMRSKIFLETVKSLLPVNSEVFNETDHHLTIVNDKISALKIEDEDYHLAVLKNNKGLLKLPTIGVKPVVLTKKCLAGHEYKYQINCL